MNYTIGELSKIMNVSIHTLRYYDNEGLLPFVQRKPNGQRMSIIQRTNPGIRIG